MLHFYYIRLLELLALLELLVLFEGGLYMRKYGYFSFFNFSSNVKRMKNLIKCVESERSNSIRGHETLIENLKSNTKILNSKIEN